MTDYNDLSNIGESKFGMKHRLNLNTFAYILVFVKQHKEYLTKFI